MTIDPFRSTLHAPAPRRFLAATALALGLAMAGFLGGCAAPTTAPPPSTASTPLQQTTDRLTDLVLAQTQQLRPATALPPAAVPVSVAPALMLDAAERRPQAVQVPVPRWIAQRIAEQHRAFAVVPEGDASARVRLRARLEPEDAPPAAGLVPFVLTVEALDAKDGALIVAVSERVRDLSLQSLVATRPAERPPAPLPVSDSVHALNAEYVALLKAGKDTEAQAVFKRIVAEGLATRNLPVRLLFAPASSEFYPDPVLIRRYGSWLGEVADQLSRSTQCLEIVGHASRTGSEAANRRLSNQRALAVRRILLKHAPALGPRLSTVALGRSQTEPGAAPDEMREAGDRRVDLKVVDCP